MAEWRRVWCAAHHYRLRYDGAAARPRAHRRDVFAGCWIRCGNRP